MTTNSMKVKRNAMGKIIIFALVLLGAAFAFQLGGNLAFADNDGLNVSISKDSQGVMGKTKTVTINLENKNESKWIFNVGFEVELDEGLEWKSSPISPNNVIEVGGEQVLAWVDIKDLAPEEKFSFSFDVKIRETKRNTEEEEVEFGSEVTGKVTVEGSNNAQTFGGIKSEGNEFKIKVMPYEVILHGGGKLLKGAGDNTGAGDDGYRQKIRIEIINNSKYAVTVDELTNTIANGVQVTDINSLNSDPYTENLYKEENYGQSILEWKNIALAPDETKNISYNAAIFDTLFAFDEDGLLINQGEIIADGKALPIEVTYNGCVDDESYVYPEGNEGAKCEGTIAKNLIAKEMIIDKSLSKTDLISYGGDFYYTIKVRVNQYHDMGDIVITDALGDGLEFQSDYKDDGYEITDGSFKVTEFDCQTINNGVRNLVWTISNSEEGETKGQFKRNRSYSLKFQAKVKDEWYDGKDIVAGDSFVNNVKIQGTNMDTEIEAVDNASVHTNIPLPSIEKKVISVNDEEDFKKEGERVKANIGDIIEFQITYKAENIGVKQKDVEIVDIFPQGTELVEGSIVYGDEQQIIWETAQGENDKEYIYIPGNGNTEPDVLRWEFTTLEEGVNNLTVNYKVEVKDEPVNTNAKQTFNLAKLAVENTASRIQSKRAEVGLIYTEPILEITKVATPVSPACFLQVLFGESCK